MSDQTETRSTRKLNLLGRALLKRLERPVKSYQKRIINNMNNLYRVIRKGDVVLVEGRSEISRLIKLMTNSTWSHSALYVGNALQRSTDEKVTVTLQSAGEPHLHHMLIEADSVSGVAAAPLNKYCDDNIRICRPFGISPQDLDDVIRDVISNLGKHYDHNNIIDLGLMLLPSFLNPFKTRTVRACLGGCTEYEVICSGMIAKAFQKVGYPIIPALQEETESDGHSHTANPYGTKLIMRHYSQIVPRDFDLSPNFEVIKYNIIGMETFDYRSIWSGKPAPRAISKHIAT